MPRKNLSAIEKVKVLDLLKSKSVEVVAKELGLGRSTLVKVKRDEASVRELSAANSNRVEGPITLIMATIPEFFDGKNVFVTGVSGFLGKVLMEKLLRSCPGVKNIYVLLREKRGVKGEDRLRKILSERLFDNLRENEPESFSKVKHIPGDLLSVKIIFNEGDVKLLQEKVNVVIHSAATVRFNETLRKSIKMNLEGTKKLLDFAKEVKDLKAFVHVSTAYTNCNLKKVEEKTYKCELDPFHAIALSEWMSDELMEHLTAQLLKDRPNTYCFTKALAENLVEQYSSHLPIAIVRPSIITGAAMEPLPGWTDNYNGPNGLLIALGTGALTTLYSNLDCIADLIPVDYVANTILAAAKQSIEGFKIYHCTTGTQNPINWRTFMKESIAIPLRFPTKEIIWYPSPKVTSHKWLHETRLFLKHYVPVRIADAVLRLTNGRKDVLRLYQRLSNSMDLLEFFATNEWAFDNTNTQKLFENLHPSDKEQFNCDVRTISWPSYVYNYCLGIRQYVLNVDLNDLDDGKTHLRRLKFIRYAWNLAVGYAAWTACRSMVTLPDPTVLY